jgi:hypothetical protein
VAVVGLLADVEKRCAGAFRREGDLIALLGTTRGALGGSELLAAFAQKTAGLPPRLDVAAELALHRLLRSLIGGGLLSLYFLPDAVSVGASGGIVGLLGYITVYAFRRRRFISPQFRKSLLINIGFLFVFGLILFNVVDNYGHLGGLITGAVYGLIQIPSNEYVDPRQAHPITKIFGAAAVGIFVATCLLSILLIFNFRNTRLPESLDATSSNTPAR